jgi:hypothetical protein
MGNHSDCWFGEPCAIGKPAECPKEIARAKRVKGTPWSQIVVRAESGGLRHYLEGRPIHCGYAIELQRLTFKSDDYGEYSVPLQEGDVVRYEAAISDREIRATLHAGVGGHEFVTRLDEGMRFRWPEPQR